MSVYVEQVQSSIKRAVQDVLSRGLNDPRVRGLVSVTRVEVTPDCAEARVHVSILPEDASSLTMHGLEAATGHVTTHVAKAVRMKKLPRLSWRLDESLKREARMADAIRRAAAADETDAGAGEDAGQEARP